MPLWEVIYADSRSGLLVRRFVTPSDLELWTARPDRAVLVVAPPDYAAEMVAALPETVAQPRLLRQAEGRALSSFIPARSSIRFIEGKYDRSDTAATGVRSLIGTIRFRRWKGVFILQTSPGVAHDFVRRADKDLTGAAVPTDPDGAAEFRKQIEREVGPIPVPDRLAEMFVGDSVVAREVRRSIVLAARSTRPVLISGESGTGKEIVARAIHSFSSAAAGPFIVVNCGAIPSERMETGLIGGRGSGPCGVVVDRAGLFGAANGGCLFLEEISDLSPAHQAMVFTMLDEGYHCRLVDNTLRPGNAQVIAATRRDLLRLVRQERFREELYFKLVSYRIPTPALRDHADDIPILAAHFWAQLDLGGPRPMPAEAWSSLKEYAWSGNARELKAFLEELDLNLVGRVPTAALIRLALQAWKGRAEPRDYSWASDPAERTRPDR